MLDDELEQGTLFEIEGPYEDACVWLVAGRSDDAVVVNLGPREAVATKLPNWLAGSSSGSEHGR
jgi:hypothetical protein